MMTPLVKDDSGHGKLFKTFEVQLMMVLQRPLQNARGKLIEMDDKGNHLEITKKRADLDAE